MQSDRLCSKIWESRKYNGNGQEGNERDERPVDRKSRDKHDRESKGDGEECGGTSKRNDDGSIREIETEVSEIKSTTESMKREIKKVKAEQDEMRSMIAEELKEREEKAEKRMNDIMRGKIEIEGKHLDEVKREVIIESLKEIKKEKDEDERKIERIYGKVE